MDGGKSKRRSYIIAVSDGVGIKEYPALDRYAYNDGFVYEYKNEKGETDMVLVPHGYAYGQVNGSLIIGKNVGNASAARLIRNEFLMGGSIDRNAPGDDLSMLARTHVMAKGYKTVYEKNVPWRWLIIGIAVLVAVIAVVWFIKSQEGA